MGTTQQVHPEAGGSEGLGGGGSRSRPVALTSHCLAQGSCRSFEMRTLSTWLSPDPGKDACTPSDTPSLPTVGPVGSRWRDYSALAVIMAGIAFGFHQLYKVGPPSQGPLAFSPFCPLPSFTCVERSAWLPWQERGCGQRQHVPANTLWRFKSTSCPGISPG